MKRVMKKHFRFYLQWPLSQPTLYPLLYGQSGCALEVPLESYVLQWSWSYQPSTHPDTQPSSLGCSLHQPVLAPVPFASGWTLVMVPVRMM